MNQKLADQMCALIARTYAVPIEQVIAIYDRTISIDETNKQAKEIPER